MQGLGQLCFCSSGLGGTACPLPISSVVGEEGWGPLSPCPQGLPYIIEPWSGEVGCSPQWVPARAPDLASASPGELCIRSRGTQGGFRGPQALEYCPTQTGKCDDRQEQAWPIWETPRSFPEEQGTALSGGSQGHGQCVLPSGVAEVAGPWCGQHSWGVWVGLGCTPLCSGSLGAGPGCLFLGSILFLPSSPRSAQVAQVPAVFPRILWCPLCGRSELMKEARVLLPTPPRLGAACFFFSPPSVHPLPSLLAFQTFVFYLW